MQAWNEVAPEENRLWDAILDWPGHVIVTMRAKQTYEISRDDRGKTTVEKLGMGAIQRDAKEYEFDVVGRMDMDNTLIIEKSRCEAISGKSCAPGSDIAGILREWLGTGSPSRASMMTAIKEVREGLTLDADTAQALAVQNYGCNILELTDDQLAAIPALLQEFSEELKFSIGD